MVEAISVATNREQLTRGMDSSLVGPPSRAAVWCVAYTYPRHEFKVSRQVETLGLPSFLPTYESLRRWHDRHVTRTLPLFPGYVFVGCPVDARSRLLQLSGVIDLVRVGGRMATLAEEEIEAVRRTLATRKAQPCPFLVKGKRVRFRGGALDGLEGVVLRRKQNTRVVVSIDSIQRSISVEASVADLQHVA